MNRQVYDYDFDASRLYPHEIAIIGEGKFGGFFPTTFVFGTERITAVYDCNGFSPLSGFRIEYTSDILYILEKVLLILRSSGEYLLLPERVLLLPETVFYRQETGDVRITYIPVCGKADIHRNISDFLLRIQVDLCDPYRSYLDAFAVRIKKENLDISSMLTLVGVLRRDLDKKIAEL